MSRRSLFAHRTAAHAGGWLLALRVGVTVGVCLLLYLHAVQLHINSHRRIGIGVQQREGRLVVTSVTPEGPAHRAGLRPGDIFLTVGEAPITSERDYDLAAAGFRRGQPVPFRLLRGAEEVVVEVLPGAPVDWGAFALQLVVALGYLAVALVAARHWTGDLRARLLFGFTALVAVEVALPNPVIGNVWLWTLVMSAFYLLSGAQMGVELHLASVIPTPHSWTQRYPWVIPAFYAAGATFAALAIWSLLAGRFALPPPPLLGAGQDGPLLRGILPLWAVSVALLVGSQALHHPTPVGRHQASLVLLGVLPWMTYVVLTFAMELGGVSFPPWLGQVEPFALLAYPLAVLAAIFRYQLFDLELVVRRSMVYGTLTGLLVLLFYAGVGLGGALVAQVVGGEASVWVIAGATLLVGLLFAPLHRGVQHFVERQFFPERHLLRQRLTALTAELVSLGKLPLMGQHLVEKLRDILGVRGVTLLLLEPRSHLLLTLASSRVDTARTFEASFLLSPDDPGVQLLARHVRPLPRHTLAEKSAALAQRLEFFDAALAVPVLVSRRLVGLLLFGEKVSGDRFRAEELELLELISLNVGITFENARLYESATYDGLTGLLRRERILEQLDRELARALRYHRPLSVGLADVDHFKQVNDTYGHLVGDSLLSLVARTLSSALRTTDAVGRYGGEEFLLLLPETDGKSALVVAEKLRRNVEHAALRSEDGREVRTTISIGLASLEELVSGEPVTAAALIALADARLLAAKRAGRNRVAAS